MLDNKSIFVMLAYIRHSYELKRGGTLLGIFVFLSLTYLLIKMLADPHRLLIPITWIGWVHFYFGNQLKHTIQLHGGYCGALWMGTSLLNDLQRK